MSEKLEFIENDREQKEKKIKSIQQQLEENI